MDVVKATPQHIEQIAQLLSNYFETVNQSAGYNKFRSDVSTMESVVSERINGKSPKFHYLSLQTPDGEFAGFANTMILDNIGQILVLLLLPEFDNLENTKLLFDAAVDDIKENKLNRIYTEVSKHQSYLKQVVDQAGGEAIGLDMVFNV